MKKSCATCGQEHGCPKIMAHIATQACSDWMPKSKSQSGVDDSESSKLKPALKPPCLSQKQPLVAGEVKAAPKFLKEGNELEKAFKAASKSDGKKINLKQRTHFAWAVIDKRTGALRAIYKEKGHALYYQQQNYIHSAQVMKIEFLVLV